MRNAAKRTRENRTITVDVRDEATSFRLIEDGKAFLECVLTFLLALGFQLKHKATYGGGGTFTRHSHDVRVRLNGVPIWRLQCTRCRAVLTVLPHFVLRYRSVRPDVAKTALLATHGGLSLELCAVICHVSPMARSRLVCALGSQSVVAVLTRCGLPLPTYVLADEKHSYCLADSVYLPAIGFCCKNQKVRFLTAVPFEISRHGSRQKRQKPVFATEPPRLPTAVDLFCGCGGFGLGFIQAGFEVVAASDWDVPAAVTYMTNLCRYGELTIHFIEKSDEERLEKYLSKSYKKGSVSGGPLMAGSGWIASQPRSVPGVKHFFLGDIRKLTGARILDVIGMKKGEVDCVTGGPPCQGYSTAGKQDVMDPRNSLVFDFARMILEIHPKTMVFENVPGIIDMVTPDGVPVLDAFSRILEDGSFMTIDALKRTVEAQTGAVGILRGGKGSKSKPKRRTKNDGQASLFDDEVYDEYHEPMEFYMQSKFTKGPYAIDSELPANPRSVIARLADGTAISGNTNGPHADEEDYPNACLFAAAWELYEKLEAIIKAAVMLPNCQAAVN
jgi:DNA (cytosine-5)-methyltransferase 1